MNIQIGQTYNAVLLYDDPHFRGYMWTYQIVGTAILNGQSYYLGLVNKGPAYNQSAMLFDENGRSPDDEYGGMGMRIISKSRAKPKWATP